MSEIKTDEVVSSWANFLEIIDNRTPDFHKINWLFRGQGQDDKKWPLKPAISKDITGKRPNISSQKMKDLEKVAIEKFFSEYHLFENNQQFPVINF